MVKKTWRSVSVSVMVMAALAACGADDGSGGAASGGQTARMLAAAAVPAFGVTASGGYLTVSSGAGLVFKVNQTNGDITSITYNGGAELQDQSKGSHIASGLGSGTTVTYSVDSSVAKITLTTSTLVHYLLVKTGVNNIYMGTYITAEPSVGELRWITRLQGSVLTNVPAQSNNNGNTGAIESSDVFGHADGTTTSKYYGNQRAMDLGVRGVTGSGIGVYMAYGNRESSSGGPFFRDIQNQSGTDSELYNYMNSGHEQTEAIRTGFHGPYALLFNDGTSTPSAPDMTWMANYNLSGWVPTSGRGKVVLNGLSGMNGSYTYTVGFANATAQYWGTTTASGGLSLGNMKPGTYTMTVYKNELGVYSEQVTVTAGGVTTLNTRTISGDPSTATAVWRIGDWDGTPLELMNGQTFNIRHPSDSRNTAWGPVTYAVGSANNKFPAAQWKTSANSPTTVTFNLTSAQVAAHTIRIGITAAYAGGRPSITVNSWTSSLPSASSQPDSRSLTIGTYRGNNTTYTFSVPASAFVAGTNTLTINTISGSSGTGFLSPGFSYDAVDML